MDLLSMTMILNGLFVLLLIPIVLVCTIASAICTHFRRERERREARERVRKMLEDAKREERERREFEEEYERTLI